MLPIGISLQGTESKRINNKVNLPLMWLKKIEKMSMAANFFFLLALY